jgi:hypothetical protein
VLGLSSRRSKTQATLAPGNFISFFRILLRPVHCHRKVMIRFHILELNQLMSCSCQLARSDLVFADFALSPDIPAHSY